MDTKVKWRLVGDIDPAWRWTRVLYAYLHPEAPELLYIGKADGLSSDLRRRWCADDKLMFWRDLEHQRGIYSHRVLVGEVHLEAGNRLSQELLADMESLSSLPPSLGGISNPSQAGSLDPVSEYVALVVPGRDRACSLTAAARSSGRRITSFRPIGV